MMQSMFAMPSISLDEFLVDPSGYEGIVDTDLNFPEEESPEATALDALLIRQHGVDDPTSFKRESSNRNRMDVDFIPFANMMELESNDLEATALRQKPPSKRFIGTLISSDKCNEYTKTIGSLLDIDLDDLDSGPCAHEDIPTASFLSAIFSDDQRLNKKEKPEYPLKRAQPDSLSSMKSSPVVCKPAFPSETLPNDFRHDQVFRRLGNAHHVPYTNDKFTLPTANLSPSTTAITCWETSNEEATLESLCDEFSSNFEDSLMDAFSSEKFPTSICHSEEGSKPLEPTPLETPSSTVIEEDNRPKQLNTDVGDENTELLCSFIDDKHRSLVTDYTNHVINQLEVATFSERDRKGNRTKVPIHFKGMACRHCKGFDGRTGRYFPSSLKTLADSKKTLYAIGRHLEQCKYCPNDVKTNLRDSMKYHAKDIKEKYKRRHGSQRAYFRKIWESLHPRE